MVLRNLIRRVVGDPNERDVRRYSGIVEEINELEPEVKALSNDQLRAKTDEFKARLAEGEAAGESLDDNLEEILPEAFAVVREAAVRTIGQRHFDVQLIGGMVLHQGKIAEMKTGEGKTLVASLPLYLNALTGKGSHLVTPNDYLSKVGLQMMGPIYYLLGLKAAVIQNAAADPSRGSFLYDPTFASDDERYQNLRPITRREAYEADITYGTNNEFGFDYLRDNMVRSVDEMVQRGHHYAIVDEVDNILIDEARTPLIISGTADKPSDYYGLFARMVRILKPSSEQSIEDETPDGDYVEDPKTKTVYLTEAGVEKIESGLRSAKVLHGDDLYGPENSEMLPYLDNSLRAMVVYHRDKDYMVEQGQVIIVDEFTGRPMYGRRFAEGLHQAIEAKEGVQVQRENLTLATITFQNYFRMYEKLAGMTGTAMTEADEFLEIYKLDVVAIPTNLPCIRIDHEDLVYMTERAKWEAVVSEIKTRSQAGQPILVGTVAIETSERLSKLLERASVPHKVLNAKQHEREAIIIAQAGRPGAVTIATNMAGRGVDILLGGNPDGLAREKLRSQGIEITEATPEQWQAALDEAKAEVARDRVTVVNAGGLHVVGTERHEARRIDNQLRGRSGRQGDPGSSRFYLSLEDDLMRRFGGERVKGFMKTFKMPEGEPIEHGLISKSIQQAQVKVEGYNFDIRKRVLEYDDVVNKQREVIYRQRQQILHTEGFLRILQRLTDQANAVADYAEDLGKPAAERPALPAKDDQFDSLRDELQGLTNLIHAKDDQSSGAIEDLIDELEDLYEQAERASFEDGQPDEKIDAVLGQAEELLRKFDLREQIERMTAKQIGELVEQYLPKDREAWEIEELYRAALTLYPVPEHIQPDHWQKMDPDDISVELTKGAIEVYDALEEKISPAIMRVAERQVMLRAIDQFWIRHLTDLDVLREGIGLVAIGQRDPLVEYKREAFTMWGDLQAEMEHLIVQLIYRIELAPQPPQAPLGVRNIREGGPSNGGSRLGMPMGARPQPVSESAPEPMHADVWDRTGRNELCPCGSGKKYKNCHYRQVQEQRKAMPGGGKRYRK